MKNSKQGIVNEIHKSARKNFPRKPVIVKGIDDLWQADLVEMIPYAKMNKNYKYLLTVIDVFSKKAYAEPVLRKTAKEVAHAMNKIFHENKKHPVYLQTDAGKEFHNKFFNDLMEKNNIKFYSTHSPLKASVVERFNRTLKNNMWKQFSMQGTYKWINILNQLVKNYNNTKHSTIKMKPNNVSKKNEKNILHYVYNTRSTILSKNKFNIGDVVRISKYKTIFEKGYTPNFTTELFRVINVNRKFPVTYHIEDMKQTPIAGQFYEMELQKTKYPDSYLVEKVLKRKGKKVFVKWLGFPSSENSWVSENEIFK